MTDVLCATDVATDIVGVDGIARKFGYESRTGKLTTGKCVTVGLSGCAEALIRTEISENPTHRVSQLVQYIIGAHPSVDSA